MRLPNLDPIDARWPTRLFRLIIITLLAIAAARAIAQLLRQY